MQIRSVGIDLGKTSVHLVALGDNGKVLLKRKFRLRHGYAGHGDHADIVFLPEALCGASPIAGLR
jgi:sugar (pentulose or hexulose) kinase